MKTIVVTGVESTGKTTLSQFLATHYNCPWVPEYAREFLTQTNGEYQQSDLIHIAEMQKHWIEKEQEGSSKLLICDTGLLVVYVWSMYKYGNVAPPVKAALADFRPNLYLIGDLDWPWSPDPLREHPGDHDRNALQQMYLTQLDRMKIPYMLLRGSWSERCQKACASIDKLV